MNIPDNKFKADNRFREAVGALNTMFAPAAPAKAPATPAQQETAMGPEERALFDLKKNILAQVRTTIPEGERPTLEQYRLACENFTTTPQGATMAANNQWNAKIFADLSGQDLSGFTITEPKKQTAGHHLDQKIEAPQEENTTHGHHNNIGKNYDGNDLDGDGQVNSAPVHAFYDNIRFEKADLHGAFVEPATSFNDEIAKAGNLEGMTFNGMKDGDKFVFGAGQYKDVRMTNINVNQEGGITFANNSQVDGISIEGKAAKITIGDHASLNHVTVSDDFSIIRLEMGRNSVISNSDLGKSTVSMTSHFEPGATFQNVQLSGNLNGLDFSGLKLHNVSIDGEPISHPTQLAEYGITHNAHTVATTTSSLLAQQTGIAGVGATLVASKNAIGNALKPEENQHLEAIRVANEARLEQERSAGIMLPPHKA